MINDHLIDLMIIGAQKAGTTSLNNYLNQHPQLLGHPQTEFAYFRDNKLYQNNFEEEFQKHFTKGSVKEADKIVAKNVGIYNCEVALQRLQHHNPACQLVFVIREPVARAYSSYTMEIFNGWLKRDFSELKSVLANKDTNDVMYKLFIELGLYANHLRLIYKYFSQEQVKIVLFDDLKEKPEAICRDIFQWVEVDQDFVPEVENLYNVTKKAKSTYLSNVLMKLRRKNNPVKRFVKSILPYSLFSYMGQFLLESNKSSRDNQPMSTEMKSLLRNYFEPHITDLEELTGRELKERWGYTNQ